MSDSRAEILGRIRRSLKRGPLDGPAAEIPEKRLAQGPRGPQPARAQLPRKEQVALFETMASEVQASVERLSGEEAVPEAVSRWLQAQNLPAKVKIAPDPDLTGLDWKAQSLLEVETGRAEATDQASVTTSFAGIAETGTLLLLSGPAAPTGLNFLPDNHVVVLRASDIVGRYEEAWDRLRAAQGPEGGRGVMPRTANLITGPSRTADIEQTIQLGAHGPRRLHILLIEDDPAAR